MRDEPSFLEYKLRRPKTLRIFDCISHVQRKNVHQRSRRANVQRPEQEHIILRWIQNIIFDFIYLSSTVISNIVVFINRRACNYVSQIALFLPRSLNIQGKTLDSSFWFHNNLSFTQVEVQSFSISAIWGSKVLSSSICFMLKSSTKFSSSISGKSAAILKMSMTSSGFLFQKLRLRIIKFLQLEMNLYILSLYLQ